MEIKMDIIKWSERSELLASINCVYDVNSWTVGTILKDKAEKFMFIMHAVFGPWLLVKWISAKIFCIHSHTMTLTTLPWKQNWLLFSRWLLIAECPTTAKSVRLVKPVLRKFMFCIWASSAFSVTFPTVPPTHFYLALWPLWMTEI
jgi:hypothetical protein